METMPPFQGQHALLRAAHDFAPTPPSVRYAIISTPRSGSSMLAMALWRTGRLGAPLEYFNYTSWMLQMSGRLGVADIGDYVRKLMAARTSANGVFGFKAHTDHIRFLLIANMWRPLAVMKLVRIRRRDRLAQAVSLAIAGQTGRYSSLDAESRVDPEYSSAAIQGALNYLAQTDAVWEALAKQIQTPVLTVDYERLAEAEDDVVAEVIAFIEPPAGGAPVEGLPRFERQADQLNTAWAARFKAETGAG